MMNVVSIEECSSVTQHIKSGKQKMVPSFIKLCVDLTSSLYRSMWTIGRSQRVEEKKYRPIVRKIRHMKFEKYFD
jgi:hypothetical protein